jgi:hypothetical protein
LRTSTPGGSIGSGADGAGTDRPHAATQSSDSRTSRFAVLLAVLVGLSACAPRPLLERAIRSRGGPLHTVVRRVEANVRVGFPGTWHWRSVFMLPDRYAWSLETNTDPYHYLFDGRTVRAFIGGRLVAVDDAPSSPLRSHARLTAVVNLDALRLPGVSVAELAPDELPPGTVAGLRVAFASDGAQYRLGFDRDALLTLVTGPVDLTPFGRGEMTVRFADFRSVRGMRMPFRASWALGETPLAEERAVAVCPNVAGLTEDAFRDPAALPTCD